MNSIVISALTGGLAGAIAAHWFAIWRDRRGRKHVFRAYTRSVIAELKAIEIKMLQQDELFRRHQATVPGIRSEAAKVFDDIGWCQRLNFEDTWVAYCGLKKHDVEPDEFHPLDNTAGYLPNYERGRQTVIGLLEKMVEMAK